MAKRAANEMSKKPTKAPPLAALAAPLTDADLAPVAGGYIGETEKNIPPRF